MSAENVEIVRKLCAAFDRRDHESAFEFYDPDIEWDASRAAGLTPDEARVYRGHDGVRDYWQNWLSAWRDIEYSLDDVRDGGDEVVALIGDQHQYGRHSGIRTDTPPYALVFTFRSGKVVRWCFYPDREQALEAAGLGRPDASG